MPGTSSARIFGSGDSEPLTFEAQKGQETTITIFSTTFGEIKLLLKDAQTGNALGEVKATRALVVVLPNDGDYVLAPSVVSTELAPGFDARIETR